MPVNTNALEIYDSTTIREDLSDLFTSITPTTTPFMNLVKKGKATQTNHEWTELDLAAVNTTNRTYYGDPAPANDAPTLNVRKNNFIQLSDKVAEVTSTAQVSKGVADVETMAKQIVFKTKELKRDMEAMSLFNVAASAGSSGTAATSAGLPSFLITNANRGSGATAPTTSGAGGAGYPNAAAGGGTDRALTDAIFKDVINQCWESGAEPTTVMCGGLVKQKISTFTNGSTIERTAVANKKELPTAIDVYISDFGTLQIIPNRFQLATDIFILDPEYLSIDFLQTMKQEPLAKTGHSDRRMLSVQWCPVVLSEKSQGIIADIDGAL